MTITTNISRAFIATGNHNEDEAWTAETVTLRIREAWDCLRRVPAGRVAGYRSSWPDALRDVIEAVLEDKPVVRLSPASPQAIDRMYETFGWFKFLEDQQHLTRALWLTAGCGMGPKRAGLILGAHRDTIRSRRDTALDLIASGLNRTGARAAQLISW